MVSLTLMARLLEAVRPDARLVLVGDPDQLASVEAGAVLGDLVARAGTGGPTPARRRWPRWCGDLGLPDASASCATASSGSAHVRRFGGAIAAWPSRAGGRGRRSRWSCCAQAHSDLELVAPDDVAALRADVVAAGSALHDGGLRGRASRTPSPR